MENSIILINHSIGNNCEPRKFTYELIDEKTGQRIAKSTIKRVEERSYIWKITGETYEIPTQKEGFKVSNLEFDDLNNRVYSHLCYIAEQYLSKNQNKVLDDRTLIAQEAKHSGQEYVE